MSLQTLRIILGIIVFFFGASFGSFFGVVVDRVPNGKKIGLSRSVCDECNQVLPWYTLVPILSYLFLDGKCAMCHKKISPVYLFYEFVVGGLFLLAFILWGINLDWLTMLKMIIFWSMLFVVGLMDYKYMVINDGVLIVFSILNIIVKLIEGIPFTEMLYGFAVGFGFYLIIYFVAKLIYKKEAFGQGDVTFAGALGIFLGPSKMFVTCFLAFYVCLVLYIIGYLKSKDKENFGGEIPFGPSMCITGFVMSLYGQQIMYFFMKLMGLVG